MPDLTQLSDVKAWLGITDSASDALLTRLISVVSQKFLNKIRRTDLCPAADWTDRIFSERDYWWRGMYPTAVRDALHTAAQGRHEIFTKHYPINSITSVTSNGVALDLVTDPTDLTQNGYWFDTSRIGEDRQKISLIGYVFPAFNNTWDILPNLVITYNAGYASTFSGTNCIPQDIQQAVIEWVALERGMAQLQSANQAATGFKIGTYEQSLAISPLTIAYNEAELPISIQSVIDHYSRPVSL